MSGKLIVKSWAKKAVAVIANVVSPPAPHRCDPEGFSCDCARRAAVNAGHRGHGWLGPRRRGWLQRRGWPR